jgi:hypothetical protein
MRSSSGQNEEAIANVYISLIDRRKVDRFKSDTVIK